MDGFLVDHRPKAAFSAIGGEAAKRIAASLLDGGVLILYGLLDSPCATLDLNDIIFRDVAVRGFWLKRWFENADPEELRRLLGELTSRLENGEEFAAVEAIYPFSRISEAVAHAERSEKSGKVLLRPDP